MTVRDINDCERQIIFWSLILQVEKAAVYHTTAEEQDFENRYLENPIVM